MDFNTLARTVVEVITPGTIPTSEVPVNTEEAEGKRGRAANPQIAKLVAQGIPYWKARAMVNRGLAGDETPSAAPVTPDATIQTSPELVPPTPDSSVTPGAAVPLDFDAATTSHEGMKTQAAVDEYMEAHPEATVDDVVKHLIELNSGPNEIKFVYITSPSKVKEMMASSKEVSTGVDGELEEPTPADIDAEKKAKFDRLRAFMKLPRAERDRYLANAKKLKKELTPGVEKDEEEDKEDDDDEDEEVKKYVRAMKDDDEDEEEVDASRLEDT